MAIVELLAHQIQGTSADMGTQALEEGAFEIENAGSDGNLDMVPPLVGRIEQAFGRLGSVVS